MTSSLITGTGSYIPEIKKENKKFLENRFLNSDGTEIPSDNAIIIEKFKAITGIEERRYAASKYNTSNYSWKPIIIYEVCEKYNNMVYWIDTRCLIQDLTKVLAIVSENGIYSPDTGYSSDDAIYKWTHNTTLNYMDARKYQHCRPRSGGIFLINYNIDWCKKLV